MSTENIEVIHLGEDGDLWLVTGTTDAHSAEEEIRKIDRELGTYLEDEDQLKFEYRRNLVWRHGGLKPSQVEDDEVMTEAEHFERYAHENKRVHPFDGFWVTL